MKKKFTICFIFVICLLLTKSNIAQQMPHSLIGYWHNWNTANAPFIPLDEVDSRYNVIILAFAISVSNSDMHLVFTPSGWTPQALTTQIAALQNQGKKVLISIGGGTGTINLTSVTDKENFVSTMNDLIDQYGFDGIDIDIENGNTITISGGTIAFPTNQGQIYLIESIKEMMQHYRMVFQKKMMLTAAPETAYIQGGMSGFGSIWGAYLPIIDALRDSIDILQVQLYNSGTMYGIDGNIYTQGTADFIVSQTEAVIQGFSTSGGLFAGIPAHKIAVGLPACNLAAGGGYTDTAQVGSAIRYLMGKGPKPGNYTLFHSDGYPDLCGLMTWSINWDATTTCGESYLYATQYENLFGIDTIVTPDHILANTFPTIKLYPNPNLGSFFVDGLESMGEKKITILNSLGLVVAEQKTEEQAAHFNLNLSAGLYFVQIACNKTSQRLKFVVAKD